MDWRCPFTSTSIEEAYGAEVSLFLHCHLRGYDRHGEGKHADHEYYDKYGAPVKKDDSWVEGYHVVEKKLADHYNKVVKWDLDFPLIAGLGGGVHLYKELHGKEGDKPWNWTGWIPRQKRWLSQGTFFSNRYFLSLRGNEIQNNLWDYHPDDEEEGSDITDLEYSQLEPNDRYRGGYWFYRQPFGRYLHIVALKALDADPKTNECKRYNYIVHPLAYRSAIATIPDNSVDAMQWCIINMPEEEHFGKGKPWGDKCHGLEIFNDFTYFYSYQPIEEDGPKNGELGTDKEGRKIDGDSSYYYWFDTYPLEFAVFLLDSALARGVYFHTMAANDAFYERTVSEVSSSDPKGNLFAHIKNQTKGEQNSRQGVKKAEDVEYGNTADELEDGEKIKKVKSFFKKLPYRENTVFGSAVLFDPRRQIKEVVFTGNSGISAMGLDEGEKLVLDYLIKGRCYATTGIWDLFDYDYHSLPYKIFNQPDPEELCYDITDDMELVFTFLPVKKKNAGFVWRCTIMTEKTSGSKNKEVDGITTNHIYFKLDANTRTKVDLKHFEKYRVKWLYFTAMKPKNPQNRAWLHAIRGPAFGQPCIHAKLPSLNHNVFSTERKENTVTINKCFSPESHEPGDLDFSLGKLCKDTNNKHDIFVYSLQVCPHQQDLTTKPVKDAIKESSDLIPPRILQSVHGFFKLRFDHPTRLNLSASWDKDTVNGKVQFYAVDAEKGEPKAVPANFFAQKT